MHDSFIIRRPWPQASSPRPRPAAAAQQSTLALGTITTTLASFVRLSRLNQLALRTPPSPFTCATYIDCQFLRTSPPIRDRCIRSTSCDPAIPSATMAAVLGGGDGMMGQLPLEQWFYELPVCTRWWTTITVVISVLVQCHVVSPFQLFYSYRAVFYKSQVRPHHIPLCPANADKSRSTGVYYLLSSTSVPSASTSSSTSSSSSATRASLRRASAGRPLTSHGFWPTLLLFCLSSLPCSRWAS